MNKLKLLTSSIDEDRLLGINLLSQLTDKEILEFFNLFGSEWHVHTNKDGICKKAFFIKICKNHYPFIGAWKYYSKISSSLVFCIDSNSIVLWSKVKLKENRYLEIEQLGLK